MTSKEDKRQEIMTAIETLFTNRGIHEITTEDIAREAKVGKGTLYRYFQNKDDLFFQTIVSGFDELCSLLSHKIPNNIPFTEQLLCACKEIRAFFNKRRQLLTMMQTEEGHMFCEKKNIHDQWKKKRKMLVTTLAEIIKNGVTEGEVRSDISPEILAYFLLAMLKTQAKEFSAYPFSIRQPELIVDLFFKGVKKHSSDFIIPKREA
ncbi:MAG: TetR/AcrR family transcriptional regulator [bacterium]